jgi:uncharacterized protein
LEIAQFFVILAAVFLMLAGLVGIILPVVPGLVLVWLGALVYGLGAGFGQSGPWLFSIITALTIFGYALDLLLTHLGAMQTGASWQALLASLVLAVAGFFVIPVVGALVGAVLGLFLVEYYRRKDLRQAWTATRGALVGFTLSFGLQVSIGLTMIGLWLVWVWAG